jgi:hypothetical protein
LEKNSEFIDPQLLIVAISQIVPREIFFTPTAFIALSWVRVASGIMAMLGCFTRTSVFIFALTNWIFIAHAYSYSDVHHPQSIFCIFLMLLAFSPSGDRLSIDALTCSWRRGWENDAEQATKTVETAFWPIRLVHVLLAWAYFSTGLSKLVYGGLRWMNGYTLQGYILGDALQRDLPLGLWLVQHHTLCVLLSIYTIGFEFFFFVSLIIPWTAPYFLIGGILFQLGLYIFAGHPFFQHIILLVLLLICLKPERLETWGDRGMAFFRAGFGKSITAHAK